MKHLVIMFRFIGIGCILLIGFFLYGQATQAASSTTCGVWNVVANPAASASSSLYGVAALSPSNVWAVGDISDSTGDHTLIEQWNGSTWRIVPSPNVGIYANDLVAVSAVSANNVWAVGTFVIFPQPEDGVPQTLIEHWNGSAWSVVPSPNVGQTATILTSVAAVSTTDVWAVGNAQGQTLTEHWNGSTWSVVSSPNSGTSVNSLYGVTAIASNNVWAVGDTPDGVRSGSVTLIEHWNGTAWRIVSSPNVGTLGSYLRGVAAKSSTTIWTVGRSDQQYNDPSRTLTEHWNGSAWQITSSPSPDSGSNVLEGVAVISSGTVWAVGAANQSGGQDQTLIEEWNGKIWSIVRSSNVGTSYNVLFAVSASSSHNVWAVGIANGQSLIESYC
jgi:hypothetical protein